MARFPQGLGRAAASCVEFSGAAPIQAPVVDKLLVHMLIDLTHNIFLKPTTFKGMAVTPAGGEGLHQRATHTVGCPTFWSSQRTRT